MSNPLDVFFPPKKTDYALVSHDDDVEDLDGDNMVPEGYDYDTHLLVWVCKSCGAAVTNTVLHTSWHERLDKILPPV